MAAGSDVSVRGMRKTDLKFKDWLRVIAVALTALALLGAIRWRHDILQAMLDPKTPFQVYRPPREPDYSRRPCWAILPATPAKAAPGDPPADVFFIHPTSFDGGRDWNGPIGDETSNRYLQRVALPNYAAYAASKAAVDSLTRAAAIALAPFGVLVNSVAPGMMDTEMQRLTEADLARIEGRNDIDAFLAERTRRVPLGRRAEISEVAAAVLWLAVEAPAYITAERLNASGGLDRD